MAKTIAIPIEQLEKLENFIRHSYRNEEGNTILQFHDAMASQKYSVAAQILRNGLAVEHPRYKFPTGLKGLPSERILAEQWANKLESPKQVR